MSFENTKLCQGCFGSGLVVDPPGVYHCLGCNGRGRVSDSRKPYEPPAIEQTSTYPGVEFNPPDVIVYSWFKCSLCSYEYQAKAKHIAQTIVCQCGARLDVIASWPQPAVQRGSSHVLEIVMNRTR